jgi:hypothetical protein
LKDYKELLGLNGESFRRYVVPAPLDPSCGEDWEPGEEFHPEDCLGGLMASHSTVLSVCLRPISLPFGTSSFTVCIPDDRDVVIATPHEAIDCKLFPPKGDEASAGTIPVPIFEVEFLATGIPSDKEWGTVVRGILRARERFEGELLFSLLGKALRSQRNRKVEEMGIDSVSAAMEFIERENLPVMNAVLNSKSHAKVRDLIRQSEGKLYGASVNLFTSRGRQSSRRNYFVGPRESVGIVSHSPAVVKETVGENWSVSCVIQIGAIVFSRDLIAVVEEPE